MNRAEFVALHRLMRKRIPKLSKCEICNDKAPYDLANIRPDINPDTYNTDPNNWWWGCRACHMVDDGRIKNLDQTGKPSARKGKKTGIVTPGAYKKGNVPWITGRRHSEHTRRKMSESKKGRIPWNRGIPRTEVEKKKISENRKGIPAWNKGKKKVLNMMDVQRTVSI